MTVLNKRMEDLVCQFVHKDYSVCNTAYPTAICGSCRVTLCSKEKVFQTYDISLIITLKFKDPNNQRYKLPPLLDYASLAPPAPKTRNSACDRCECQICQIARKSGGEYHSFAKKQTNQSGPAPSFVKSPPAKTLAVCSKCWA